MSSDLYAFAKRFAMSEISADDFADEFIKKWKEERDAGMLTKDAAEMSERLSSVFCLADLYNPAPDREGYEIDDFQLRDRVKALMNV